MYDVCMQDPSMHCISTCPDMLHTVHYLFTSIHIQIQIQKFEPTNQCGVQHTVFLARKLVARAPDHT